MEIFATKVVMATSARQPAPFPEPGTTGLTNITNALADDKLDMLKRFDLPTLQNLATGGYNYYANQTDYGSPIDLWGARPSALITPASRSIRTSRRLRFRPC